MGVGFDIKTEKELTVRERFGMSVSERLWVRRADARGAPGELVLEALKEWFRSGRGVGSWGLRMCSAGYSPWSVEV